MASYAALLSLNHTINQIKKHPRPPISLDQSQVEALTGNLDFLLNFLERNPNQEDEDLESRIAAAAHAAEDVIESHVVDRIQAGSDIGTGMDLGSSAGWRSPLLGFKNFILYIYKFLYLEKLWIRPCIGTVYLYVDLEKVIQEMDLIKTEISTVDLYGGLEKVIQEMDLIKMEMEIIQEKKTMKGQHHDLHSCSSGNPVFTRQSSTNLVFDDDVINQVLDKLIGQQSGLQIIPIVGMGGIGKTTLARYIYESKNIVQHFDLFVWITISQEYSVPEILRQVVCLGDKEREMSENELGEKVHKKLWGRRYLIVMDDIWSTEALNNVRCFFPDNNNGSRIMITSRLSSVAFEISRSHVFRMKFLDEDKSWRLFCKTVFGNELGCPIELEDIGKEIARNCRGLPLSIVVIGGLLKKSNGARAQWEYTLQNLISLVNLKDGEYCSQILHTSYKELPIHLKPCFLYMGVFREDHKIRVTKLIELWVAEGILKPTTDKILEEVAEEYIDELIGRNLVLVEMLRWNGKAKVCIIHDLLRDLCLKEAQKQRFLCVLKHQRDLNIPECMNMERRICIHDNGEEKYAPALESASLTRSLILMTGWPELVQSLRFRLLRVYSGDYYIHCGLASHVEAIFKKANLRLLTIVLKLPPLSSFPSSWFLFWNLQTLKITIPSSWEYVRAPSEIWEMPLLRHVVINDVELPDPVCGENDIILEDLQRLSWVRNLKCSPAVIKRIPNIKTLKLKYQFSHGEAEFHEFGLNNFSHLTKLQSLNLSIHRTGNFKRKILQCYLTQNLSFPQFLKKLTLNGTMLNWEECATKIGSLPLLQFLRLGMSAFYGAEWETVEGQFSSLKFLQLECKELRYWRTEDTHFPRLEHLVLRFLPDLEEIPSCIGDIPTLKSIRVYYCSSSAVDSAKGIKEEQMELGNMDLQLHIPGGVGQNVTASLAFSSFFKEMKFMLQHHSEICWGYIDVMSDYNAQRIDMDGLKRTLEVLFKEHPHLILWFNTFFLEPEKITRTDEEEEAP